MALALGVLGCRGVETSPSDRPAPSGSVPVAWPPGDAGPPGQSEVRIVAPIDGATLVQDRILGGEWATAVRFEVESSGVERVELRTAAGSLGDADATGVLDALLPDLGDVTVEAIGRDAVGEELARDEVTLTIEAPTDTSCHAMLDALGLDWAPASATRGIADPVRVQPLINGLSFRYVSNAEPTAMLMDCELGVRLHALTELLAPYGIDEVIHIGIYNYRCIGGGDPDSGTCTPSQHAYARAIDLHAFGLAGSADTYSTEDDWVITMRDDTCPIPSSSDKDRILKEIACAMYQDRVFEIVLTPNYNDAHRNHFHVDLTEGSMYLGVGVEGVDPFLEGLGD